MLNTGKTGKSLEEVNQSIDTTANKGLFKKLLAFIGPAYLVSVGYMDPGNWATDIAGGSKFGYSLIWVLVMSNLMALLLQSLSARLGLVRGLDLAQASRKSYPKTINFFNWLLAEIAIAACDLAEVIGMAIGLQLLFKIPLIAGVLITVTDTLLLVFLMRYGIRKMEAFIIALIGIIGLAFIAQMIFASPELSGIANGLIPTIPNDEALYIAIGIIGATVMPHNLYLHSSLVQTRKFEKSEKGIRTAIKFNIIDSVIALNLALLVNAAILILAAAAFYKNGFLEVAEIQDAYNLLAPVLGTSLSPILFAVALIAAGQSSTLTGTLSGQIVMEGYLNLRLQPWLRRLITRVIAIIPALFTIIIYGEHATGKLLILSQVILSLQLGFAIIPLIHFVSDKDTMGKFAIGRLTQLGAWLCAIVIVGLNINLIKNTIGEWITSSSEYAYLIYFLVIPICIAAGLLLLYITLTPFIKKVILPLTQTPHGIKRGLTITQSSDFNRIAITVDFSDMDSKAISHAITQGGTNAEYLLIHIVETAGARMMDSEIDDMETVSDRLQLDKYVHELEAKNLKVKAVLGFGNPKISIPELVNNYNASLLVMAAHGHKGLSDILFGTTLDAVRHKVNIPVLIITEK